MFSDTDSLVVKTMGYLGAKKVNHFTALCLLLYGSFMVSHH